MIFSRQDEVRTIGAAEFAVALLTLLVGALVVAAAYGLHRLLSPWPGVAEHEPFLSGNTPTEHAVSRYHPRWYAVSLLFLAFDMEMVFMYPWAVVFAAVGTAALVEMGLFLLILVIGVLYAWREGALRWT